MTDAADQPDPDAPIVGKIGNACTPISLGGFDLGGFAMSAAEAGVAASVKVCTAAIVTSDDPIFYTWIKGITAQVGASLMAAGRSVTVEGSQFVLVVHDDGTSTLYPEGFAVLASVRVKQAAKQFQPIYLKDISDIVRVSLPAVVLKPTDKVVVCLRVGWKFILLFHLSPDTELDVLEMERALGSLSRRLTFEDLYRTMADPAIEAKTLDAGWFPFIELIGGDFEAFSKALESGFNLERSQAVLVDKFDRGRIDAITARWWYCSEFVSRQSVLQEGIDSYHDGRWVAAIKVFITEIEGILRDRHRSSVPDNKSVGAVLDHAIAETERHTGSPCCDPRRSSSLSQDRRVEFARSGG